MHRSFPSLIFYYFTIRKIQPQRQLFTSFISLLTFLGKFQQNRKCFSVLSVKSMKKRKIYEILD